MDSLKYNCITELNRADVIKLFGKPTKEFTGQLQYQITNFSHGEISKKMLQGQSVFVVCYLYFSINDSNKVVDCGKGCNQCTIRE
jgi:hypothetical protein